MKNCRWQSMFGSKRIEIGGVDLAIQPRLQAETLLFRIFKRTMADAMDGMTGDRQFAGQIAADETIGTRDPDCHDAALWPRIETFLTSPFSSDRLAGCLINCNIVLS